MKKLILFVVMLTMVLFVAACADQPNGENNDKVNDEVNDDMQDEMDDMLKLTVEELAMYDGKDGMDAYIAVDGVIYDVTGVSAWTGGSHNGNMAGTDVSDVINSAPHGDSVLDNLDVVGEIVE